MSSSSTRYLLPLEGHGKIFHAILVNLGLSTQQVNMGHFVSSEVEFTYNETFSQIFLGMTAAPAYFSEMTARLPDMRTLSHIPALQQPDKKTIYAQACRTLAMELYIICQRFLPKMVWNDPASELLLEAAAADYMIVLAFQPNGQSSV